MCTIPYQKCVCFIFLVLLAVLSCSGFPRIDNLDMMDVNNTHRVRHRRANPARRKPACPEVDISWRTYAADAVAVASVGSNKLNCGRNCTVQFTIHKWLDKRQHHNDDHIRLDFRTERRVDCDQPYFSIKDNTQSSHSKRYILFLKANGPHSYRAAFSPAPNKTKTIRIVNRVLASNFRPKPVKVTPINVAKLIAGDTHPKRLKLVCKVQGYPTPQVTWRYNDSLIRYNHFPIHSKEVTLKITQKRKRSTLVVKNAPWGRYECIAQGVDGKISNSSIVINKNMHRYTTTTTTRAPDSSKVACPQPYRTTFCLNHGTCYKIPSVIEYFCECADGYKGYRCAEKTTPQQSSTYQQSDCDIGLCTDYNKHWGRL